MVQILKLDHLEYKEAILDSPDFREKLKKHEKHIADTSKNIKLLLKKFEDVISASEALRNAQDSFSICLKEFQIGFIGDTNEEESDIVDTLECTYNLFQDIKEFSTKMINTGHTLIKQLDNFRKDRLDTLKEKKKDYERQTVKYCSTLEKYLQSQYSKKDKYSDDYTEIKEIDKSVKEENQLFYHKCLDYVICIQEFEEKWFHFFSESIFAFVQSCTAFYHEGYEKHFDCETKYSKSQGGIQALSNNFEYFKTKSKELITDILKDPDYYITSYQSHSVDHNLYTSKQGYLYLLEKKTLGSSARVKQFCKYYKEIKKFEVIPFSQTTNKVHQPEVYVVVNCQKSLTDKRFVFDLNIRDKGSNFVYTYQALSYEDYKAWFAIMEGKELTPVLSTYSTKTDPIYILDRNGIGFIKKCIQQLEEEKINEEGIYRKNGVSHKINQFIEKNFLNLSSSTFTNGNSLTNGNGSSASFSNESSNNIQNQSQSSSFITNVLKSANLPILSNSSSFSTLNFLANNQNQSNTLQINQNQNDSGNNSFVNNMNGGGGSSLSSSSASQASPPGAQQPHQTTSTNNNNNSSPNNSNSNDSFDDTCTITSALKHYLIHLKEPLMTYAYNQQFLIACRKETFKDRIIEIHKLLHSLPAINFEAIELLMKHLNKISKHSQQNKMTTSNLATCFGPTVFRAEQESVSNLYNIKFYAEIVELLIINSDEMFKSDSDAIFLQSLIPLKTPPTMLSSVQNQSAGSSSASSTMSSHNMPLPPSQLSSNNTNRVANKRDTFDPTYRNVLMNSSKTSVSSDSSQSDKELQFNSSSITSPLSSSSPNRQQMSNQQLPLNENTSSTNSVTSLNSTNNNRVSNLISTLTNPPGSTSPKLPSIKNNYSGNSTTIQIINKLAKPYNSQTGQLETQTQNMHKLAIANNNNLNAGSPIHNQNNSNNNNRSSTVSLVSLPLHGINNLSNKTVNTSPLNTKGSTNITGQTSTNTSGTTATSTASLNSSFNNHLSNLTIANIENLNNSNKPRRARTLFPCEADNPSELSFDANVIISNVRRSKESGWLEATYNGKSGLVPGNYVQILDD